MNIKLCLDWCDFSDFWKGIPCVNSVRYGFLKYIPNCQVCLIGVELLDD